MIKGENIHGYHILEDFKVAGGMSKISFAEKGGKTYFIKEFLAPKYPTPDSPGSERIKEQKRCSCEAFEKHHCALNNAIGKCCAGTGGNLIYAIDFFRERASYYKVTEKIDISTLPCSEISKLPLEKILLIAKSAVHSIRILHGLKIVHGDLKPDNLPIKEAVRGYVVKLIDFDDSYFEGNPPVDRENLVGTPEYYSPEQAAYIMDEDEEIEGTTLTCKSDIFTLGIIFCEYFTGEKPLLPSGYISTWTCVNDGHPISFCKKIHPQIQTLILKMLLKDPEERPTISDVFNALKEIRTESEDISISTDDTIGIASSKKSGLRFGPGIRPTKVSGSTAGSLLKTSLSDVTDISKAFDEDLKTKDKPRLEVSKLRGSGLKIADKR